MIDDHIPPSMLCRGYLTANWSAQSFAEPYILLPLVQRNRCRNNGQTETAYYTPDYHRCNTVLPLCAGLDGRADASYEYPSRSSDPSTESVRQRMRHEKIAEPCSKVVYGSNKACGRFGWLVERSDKPGMDVDGSHDADIITSLRSA